jgi:uncharacterized protein YjbI with pentapeptide repeats
MNRRLLLPRLGFAAALDDIDCSGADFSFLDLTSTRMERTRLTDAVFRGAKVREQDAERWRGQGADLEGAVIVPAEAPASITAYPVSEDW